MKWQNLWILVGIPCSGKSTWVKNNLEKFDNSVIISRDNIRFHLTPEDQPYFINEKKVFQMYIDNINLALRQYENIFCEATHINWSNRRKLLEALDLKDQVRVNVLIATTPLEECLRRNAQRSGRACVPETAIRRIHRSYTDPVEDPYDYNLIALIEDDEIKRVF